MKEKDDVGAGEEVGEFALEQVRRMCNEKLFGVRAGVVGKCREERSELVRTKEVYGKTAVLGRLECSESFVETLLSYIEHLAKPSIGDSRGVGCSKQGGASDVGDGIVQL